MATKTNILRLAQHSRPVLPPEERVPSPLLSGEPIAYHVSHKTQICRSCCTYHETSQVNIEIVGQRYRIFRTASKFEYDIPVHIHHEPADYILACRSCASFLDLSFLPKPEQRASLDIRSKWRANEEKKEPKTTKKITSADL